MYQIFRTNRVSQSPLITQASEASGAEGQAFRASLSTARDPNLASLVAARRTVAEEEKRQAEEALAKKKEAELREAERKKDQEKRLHKLYSTINQKPI